jgi:hypothetical protein
MVRFAAEAPQSVLACSAAGARINLQQWDYAGTFKGMLDGDMLDLGRHRLRFWETPHVHHWDSMMVVEETPQVSFLPICSYRQTINPPSFERIWERTCANGTERPACSAVPTLFCVL